MTEYKPKSDQELTDAAWSRLQEKLAQEPKSPQWNQWSELPRTEAAASTAFYPSARTSAEDLPAAAAGMMRGISSADAVTIGNTNANTNASKPSPKFAGWLKNRKKWVGGAAAVCVLTAILATPSGNEALASILNKFRMQQLTVVQENDLQAILNGAFGDGKERESINKFGTFSQVSGKSYNDMKADEASKLLGRKLILPKEFDASRSVYISSTNTITFQMNVDEVNKTMTRLGAKKLLPKSVDGKPITLEMGETVHMYVQQGDDKKAPGYSLSQQPVPTVTVDPSIPVSEALGAVLQFPMLPQNLKDSLQTAGILNGGAIPLPVIANGQTEKVKIEGVEVILTSFVYGSGEKNHSATWVQNGQLLRLDGSNALKDRQAVIGKVTELIKS